MTRSMRQFYRRHETWTIRNLRLAGAAVFTVLNGGVTRNMPLPRTTLVGLGKLGNVGMVYKSVRPDGSMTKELGQEQSC